MQPAIQGPDPFARQITQDLSCKKDHCKCQQTARKGTGLTHCPFHTDNDPSLNVSVKNGVLLVNCHAGCSQEDVIEALKSNDLWPEGKTVQPEKTIAATYDYKDASGSLLYQVVRYSPKDFRQRRPDGNGDWIWKLDDPENNYFTQRVLYGLPELLAADPKRLRFLAEGERDVETLRGMNLVATCNVGGAGKWRQEYSEWLRERDVIIIPDNDEPGRKHVHQVISMLSGIANSVVRLDLPGLKEHGDVTEWLATGGTPDQFKELVRKANNGTLDDVSTSGFTGFLNGLIEIPEISREVELFRLGCKLRQAGAPLEISLNLARTVASRCTPSMNVEVAERKITLAYQKYPSGRSLGELPSDVTLLGDDSVMIEFENARFVYSDLEKTSGSLTAEMELQCLAPGTIQEPYIQRINLLSMSTREACRRELESLFGKELKWSPMLTRSIAKAHDAFLKVDRSKKIKDIAMPEKLEYLVDGLIPDHGTTIFFGSGSSTKTLMTIDQAISICLGEPWLGHSTIQMNGLYVDYETGAEMWSYRGKRLCQGRGINWNDVPLRYWWSDGVPFCDQADAIKRCCDENDIGFLVLDHIAIACGDDPLAPETASRFYRAVSRIGRPLIAIAHVTGEIENKPEAAFKPYGSVFWGNGARRTFFMLRQQEQESSEADVGFYCRKNNDGRMPGDFGATVHFEDPDGPIRISSTSLRTGSTTLSAVRGPEWAVFDVLMRPMTKAEIVDALADNGIDMTERRLRDVLPAHPKLFAQSLTGGGRKNESKWSRVISGSVYPANSHDQNDPLPFD